jgi:hypothetical protein
MAESMQPRGMVNTGVTCYLNSAMQALASCSALAEVLHTASEVLELPTAPHQTKTDLARAFEDVFRLLVETALRSRPSLHARLQGWPWTLQKQVLRALPQGRNSDLGGTRVSDDVRVAAATIREQQREERLDSGRPAGQSNHEVCWPGVAHL